jgi:hypothetical protein
MDTRLALARLLDHQAAILAEMDDMRRALRIDGRRAQPRLAKHRWMLMRMLRAYQLFKHVEVFDPVIARADARRGDLARAMKARCTAAGDDYHRHAAAWTGAAIEARWTDYAEAVLAVADRLALHIARERRDVAVLLDGSARTRRPAAAARLSGSAGA